MQTTYPEYDRELQKCVEFLESFEDNGIRTYRDICADVLARRRKIVDISLDDIYNFRQDDEFVRNITQNTIRYIKLFEEAIERLNINENRFVSNTDVFDNLFNQRLTEIREAEQAAAAEGIIFQPTASHEVDLPKSLIRRFEVVISPLKAEPIRKLREIKAQDIGGLLRVKGMVTRVSDVKPLAAVVAYTCDVCGSTLFNEVSGPQFMPLATCVSNRCKDSKKQGRVFMQTRGTKFQKYQELRIQELPDQVPVGRIPRSVSVHCRGEMTRRCGPGDIITLTAIFMTAGLQADTYLEALGIEKHKQTYSELDVDYSVEVQARDISKDPDPYSRLAQAIAPEIYGHEDVKKALLLQLVGGVTKTLPDGMKIRGDINICLMGDPGTAKSQLLKYIASIAPRGVYTTGKGSSGVGLTAAVIKDNVTGDMVLEGGALVMADKGICCIDEFDKMDEADRTSIHEVMEQQTISIAKAGITTTLNARAAVLAAANPLFGRYNRRKSISENVDLPNSLLSRFDLLFLILDKVDTERDLALSRHVLQVHRYLKGSKDMEALTPAASISSVRLPANVIKKYISWAREVEPTVSPQVAPYIVEAYVALRSQKQEVRSGGRRGTNGAAANTNNDQTTMTARQLLSILRLSQALARLRLSKKVENTDVDEAIRLTHASKASLLDDDSVSQSGMPSEDTWSAIYTIIRDFAAQRGSDNIPYNQAEAMVLKKGFTNAQLQSCLREYASLNVLRVDKECTYITFED